MLNGSKDVVWPMDGPFGGQDDGWRHLVKHFPKTPQKRVWTGSFKSKRQNLYTAISPKLLIRRTSDLRTKFRPRKASWKSSYFRTGLSDLDEMGNLMQNNMPITAKWSRSKPEVEFQYGRRLFFKTGSCYISAMNWDRPMSTKFGSLIDYDLLKTVTSTKNETGGSIKRPRPPSWEMDMTSYFRSGCSNLDEIQVAWCRITWSTSKPEIEF